MRRRAAGVAFAVAGALGCASTHTVRPLGRGNGVVHASLGGPLVNVAEHDIPTPIFSVGGAYGARDDTEVTFHGDVTAGIFGVLHVEPGAAYHPIVRDAGLVPTVTIAGSVHLLTNFDDTLVAPQLTAAAAWRVGRRHLVYAGADSALAWPLSINGSSRMIVGTLLGGEARVGRMGISMEMKWLAPNYDVTPTAPAWISPWGRGYLTLLLGANFYVGDVK